MRKIIYLVVLVILLAISIWVKEAIDPDKNKPIDNTSDSLMYESSENGVSFSYTSKYSLEERDLGNSERWHRQISLIDKEWVQPEGGEGPTAITVDIFQNDLDQNTTMAWISSSSFSNFKLGDGVTTSISLGNESGVGYKWSGLYEGRSVVVARPSVVYMFSVTSMSPDDTIINDFEKLIDSVTFSSIEEPNNPPVSGECFVGGCSSQLCTDRNDIVSTCEWSERYACYQGAKCERQATGECGWTETPELKSCLQQY